MRIEEDFIFLIYVVVCLIFSPSLQDQWQHMDFLLKFVLILPTQFQLESFFFQPRIPQALDLELKRIWKALNNLLQP